MRGLSLDSAAAAVPVVRFAFVWPQPMQWYLSYYGLWTDVETVKCSIALPKQLCDIARF